jgi:hypothetical protein
MERACGTYGRSSEMTQKRETWLALVNMVKKEPVPKCGDFLV